MSDLNVHMANFITRSLQDNQYSPDILDLQSKYNIIPLFIYGREKRGYSDEVQMAGMPRIGHGFTVDNRYMMYRAQDTFPVVLEKPGAAAGSIQGEVYQVDIPTLLNLDDLFENTTFQQRKIVHVRYTLQAQKDAHIKDWWMSPCWMYVGLNYMWESQMKAGKLRLLEIICPKNTSSRPYYYYKQSDDFKPKKGTF